DLQSMLTTLQQDVAGLRNGKADDDPDRVNYGRLLVQVRRAVHTTLPRNATVLVVSKGDDELLRFDQRTAWHFPRTPEGIYAGHYPADSAAAVAHLEEMRTRGADYLLFPGTAFWWLAHYDDFRRHLD